MAAASTATLQRGDCLDLLRAYAGPPFTAVVTDPPGAKGMDRGAGWDSGRGGADAWTAWLTARLRAARERSLPGAWLCCWAHPSTSWMTGKAVHDAGWVVQDKVVHLNAQGRAASATRLAPGHEDWWLATAPGGAARQLDVTLPVVASPFRRRHPRNVVLDEAVAATLDAAVGPKKSGNYSGVRRTAKHRNTYDDFVGAPAEKPVAGDTGPLSRFFPVLGHGDLAVYAPKARFHHRQLPSGAESKHPTTKSPTLVAWLLRLLRVGPGALVADPFMGSGVVGEVAIALGASFFGCEAEKEWLDEAAARCAYYTTVSSPAP